MAVLDLGAGHRVLIDRDKLAIGSARGNEIRVRGAGLASVHCQLARAGSGHLLVDLDYPLGTVTVNGEKAKTHKLRPGDRVVAGELSFIYEADSARESGAEPRPIPVEISVEDGETISVVAVDTPGPRRKSVARSGASARERAAKAKRAKAEASSSGRADVASAEAASEGPALLPKLEPSEEGATGDPSGIFGPEEREGSEAAEKRSGKAKKRSRASARKRKKRETAEAAPVEGDDDAPPPSRLEAATGDEVEAGPEPESESESTESEPESAVESDSEPDSELDVEPDPVESTPDVESDPTAEKAPEADGDEPGSDSEPESEILTPAEAAALIAARVDAKAAGKDEAAASDAPDEAASDAPDEAETDATTDVDAEASADAGASDDDAPPSSRFAAPDAKPDVEPDVASASPEERGAPASDDPTPPALARPEAKAAPAPAPDATAKASPKPKPKPKAKHTKKRATAPKVPVAAGSDDGAPPARLGGDDAPPPRAAAGSTTPAAPGDEEEDLLAVPRRSSGSLVPSRSVLVGVAILGVGFLWLFGGYFLRERRAGAAYREFEVARAQRDEIGAAAALRAFLDQFPDHRTSWDARRELRKILVTKASIDAKQGRPEDALAALTEAKTLTDALGDGADPDVIARVGDVPDLLAKASAAVTEAERAGLVRSGIARAEEAIRAGRAAEAVAVVDGLRASIARRGGFRGEEGARADAIAIEARRSLHAFVPWDPRRDGLGVVDEVGPPGIAIARRVPVAAPPPTGGAEPVTAGGGFGIEGRIATRAFTVSTRRSVYLVEPRSLAVEASIPGGRYPPTPFEPTQAPGSDLAAAADLGPAAPDALADPPIVTVFPALGRVAAFARSGSDGALTRLYDRRVHPAPTGRAVVVGGAALVPARDRVLVLDAGTGRPWGHWPAGGLVTSAPAVAPRSGLVFVALDSARLAVWRLPIDPAGPPAAPDALPPGEYLGTVDLPGVPLAAPVVVGPFVMVSTASTTGGRRTRLVVLRVDEKKVAKLDAASVGAPPLTEVASHGIGGRLESPPAAAGGWIWFATDEGELGAYRVNPLAGEVTTLLGDQASHPTPYEGAIAVAPVEGGEAVVVAGDVADDARGAILREESDPPSASLGGSHGELRVYGVEPFAESVHDRIVERAGIRLPGLLSAGPVIRGDRILLAVREPHADADRVMAIDLLTLETIGSVRVAVPAAGAPLLLADGRVVQRRRDGALAEHHPGRDRLCRLLTAGTTAPRELAVPAPVAIPAASGGGDPEGPWLLVGQVAVDGRPFGSAVELRDAVTGWRRPSWGRSGAVLLRGVVAARPLVFAPEGEEPLAVVSSTGGDVHVFSLRDGAPVAQEFKLFRGKPFLAPPARDPLEGTIAFFVGCDDGTLYRLEVRSEAGGRRALVATWQVSAGAPIRAEPLVVGPNVFVGADDGKVRVVDRGRGRTIAVVETGGPVLARPLATSAGVVVVGSTSGVVVGIDEGGEERWRRKVGGAVRYAATAVPGSDGLIVVPTDDGALALLAARDGELLGRLPLASRPAGAATALADGSLLVATTGGSLLEVGIDPATLVRGASGDDATAVIANVGGRRYRLIVEPPEAAEALSAELETLRGRLAAGDAAVHREVTALAGAGSLGVEELRGKLRALLGGGG